MTVTNGELIGRRVAEARARAGLTQADLASSAGLDRSALAKIETGARRITALELAHIAESTGQSFEWFVTDPPAAINSYRLGSAAALPSSIDRLIEQIAGDVQLVQSLGQLIVAEHTPAAHPRSLDEAQSLAVVARRMLGIEPQGPVTNLVDPASEIGLFAFSEDLGTDAPDAATTMLARGGVSIINSNRAVGRRRLALAHELGHYLVADAYSVDWRVGVWTDSQRTERLLDAFGRALLLPPESLRARWSQLVSTGSVRRAAVIIASEYRVDMSTLAARLAELDLVASDDLDIVRNTTTTRGDIIENDLVVAHDLDSTTLPRRYEKAVIALYRSERISAERTADLLRGTVGEADLPPLPPVNENEIWKFIS